MEAGADALLGTGDDVDVAITRSYRDDVFGLFGDAPAPLAAGLYRATVAASLTDRAGNPLASDEIVDFVVYGGGAVDTDGDGVPDILEALLGLDPGLTDTDDDDVPDGEEDFDGDGLSNEAEVASGTDPTNADSNGNGVLDGLEDGDLDGLGLAGEFAAGTNPLDFDSDDDGYPDGVELESRIATDPLDPSSVPALTIVTRDLRALNRPEFIGPDASATWVARPEVGLNRFDGGFETGPGTFVAQPRIGVVRPDTADGTFLAQPPVSVEIEP